MVKCGRRCHSQTTTPTETYRTRGHGRIGRVQRATLTHTASMTATSEAPALSRRLLVSTAVTLLSIMLPGHEHHSPAFPRLSNDECPVSDNRYELFKLQPLFADSLTFQQPLLP